MQLVSIVLRIKDFSTCYFITFIFWKAVLTKKFKKILCKCYLRQSRIVPINKTLIPWTNHLQAFGHKSMCSKEEVHKNVSQGGIG